MILAQAQVQSYTAALVLTHALDFAEASYMPVKSSNQSASHTCRFPQWWLLSTELGTTASESILCTPQACAAAGTRVQLPTWPPHPVCRAACQAYAAPQDCAGPQACRVLHSL